MDSGRGGAEVWTLVELNREENRQLTVDISLSDAANLVRTQPIVIVINDVNDNMMKPGSKIVHLWKTRMSGSDAPLGRVYVDDPDDWDIADKTFAWDGTPNPLFSLDEKTGTIFTSGHVREGRYDLRFLVSDRVWRQKDVQANVTVIVRMLSPESLTHAVPLTLSPASPATLTKDWTPLKGGGGLGYLTKLIKSVLKDVISEVEIVSLYGSNDYLSSKGDFHPPYISSGYEKYDDPNAFHYFPLPSAYVWISVRDHHAKFIKSVKLKGLLQLHLKKLESLTSFRISTEEPSLQFMASSSLISPTFSSSIYHPLSIYSPSPPPLFSSDSSSSSSASSKMGSPLSSQPFDPSSAASLASTALPLQLVDSNTTSLVTPRLTSHVACPASSNLSADLDSVDQCYDDSCLNGGRCVPTEIGKRCICPGNTHGPNCKILTRSFQKGGWAWLPQLPHCNPLGISLKFRTKKPEGILLSSAPFRPLSSSASQLGSPRSMLRVPKSDLRYLQGKKPLSFIVIQLVDGKLSVLSEGSGGFIKIQTDRNITLADGKWHSVDINLGEKGVSLLVDACIPLTSKCFIKSSWPLQWNGGEWGSSGPIQIGGVANSDRELYEELNQDITLSSLEGCISELRIAEEVMDLGEVAYSQRSSPGCQSERDCAVTCGMRGFCPSTSTYSCSCALGWSGEKCEEKSTPSSLREESFAKIALSFSPDPFETEIQLRFRTREPDVSLLTLMTEQPFSGLSIFVKRNLLCFSLTNKASIDESEVYGAQNNRVENGTVVEMDNADESAEPENDARHSSLDGAHSNINESELIRDTSLCITKEKVSDGEWHSVKGIRRGYIIFLELDDGNIWRRNSSLRSFIEELSITDGSRKVNSERTNSDTRLKGRVTAVIGGSFLHSSDPKIGTSDQTVCIDDVRVSGHPLPLPPAINGSQWGQVTTMVGLEAGCHAPAVCTGVSCATPLVCRDDWWKSSCSCPSNYHLTPHGCRKLEKCLYEPCLNGGTCIPSPKDSYSCVCVPEYSGRNCEWSTGRENAPALGGTFLILGAALSFMFVLLILSFIIFRLWRRSKTKEPDSEMKESQAQSTGNDKWRTTAYYTENSGDMHQESVGSAKCSLGLIHDLKNTSEKAGAVGAEKIYLTKLNTKLSEAEMNKILLGIKNHPGGGEAVAPPDDLRAYAYEGDESSAGSLGSAISGLRQEFSQELDMVPITSGFIEVIDLLKNLPEAEASNLKAEAAKNSHHSWSSLPLRKGGKVYHQKDRRGSDSNESCCFSSDKKISLFTQDNNLSQHQQSTEYQPPCILNMSPDVTCTLVDNKIVNKPNHDNDSKQYSISSISKTINFAAIESSGNFPFITASNKSTKL